MESLPEKIFMKDNYMGWNLKEMCSMLDKLSTEQIEEKEMINEQLDYWFATCCAQ